MGIENLLRTLEIISVGPAYLSGLVNKQFYLNSALRKDTNTRRKLMQTFLSKTEPLMDGRRITPGGHYTGIWTRDASYILKELMNSNKLGLVGDWLERIWSNQITMTKEQKIIHGRGSPEMKYHSVPIDSESLKSFSGALPTSIQLGYCEIYAKNPDIDSTALMISVTCMYCMINQNSELSERLVARMRLAVDYLARRDVDGDSLLEQGPNEDWMDSMLRSGKIVYSQAVWATALAEWSKLLYKLGSVNEAEKSDALSRMVVEAVNRSLWDESASCFVDCRDQAGKHGPHDAQEEKTITQDICLMLLLHDEDSSKALKSLDTIRRKLWVDTDSKFQYKVGPTCIAPPATNTGPFRLAKYQYQNGAFWPWTTSFEILARIKQKQREEARELLSKTLSYALLEWVNPNSLNAGSYPFRTSVAAVRTALRAILNIPKS